VRLWKANGDDGDADCCSGEVIVEVPAQASCEDIAVYRTVEVELARPLGDRQLLDARTGRVPEFFSRS
jgi:hypothetical protein